MGLEVSGRYRVFVRALKRVDTPRKSHLVETADPNYVVIARTERRVSPEKPIRMS